MIVRVAAALAVLIGLAPLAHAQDWPNRPVRMIVPFAAGGSTDVAARLVAEYLTRSLGQQVFVENRTGANGNIGIEAAAKSAARRLHDPDRARCDREQSACLQGQLRRAEGSYAGHPDLAPADRAGGASLARREDARRAGRAGEDASPACATAPAAAPARGSTWSRNGSRSLPASSSSRCRIAAAGRRSTISSPGT